MNPFFAYLLKSTISLSLLYLLFKAFMQNDKAFVLNRFLLLGIIFISAIIPLLNIEFLPANVSIEKVDVIRNFVAVPLSVPLENTATAPSVVQSMPKEINYWSLFYVGAILLLLTRLLISVGRVLQVLKNAEKRRFGNIILAVVKEMIQPFSFLNHVVLSEKDFNENKNIIVAHERAHIKQKHAIDLAVCEVFLLLHFFNPLMWLLRRDLKLIHEFQADQAVLNDGIDAQKYQLLVLQKAVGERRFALANHFKQKPIVKRIKMMKKNSTQKSIFKLVIFIPVISFLLISLSASTSFIGKADYLLAEYQDSLKLWKLNWNYSNLNDIGQKITSEKAIGQYGEFEKSPSISWSNVLNILVDKDNRLIINGEVKELGDLDQIVKDFIHGKQPDDTAVNTKKIDIPYFSEVEIPQGVILFRMDVRASYVIIQVITERLSSIYLELRDQKSTSRFNQPYLSLDEDKRSAIEELIPIRLTTGEPKLDAETQEVVFYK